MASDGVLLPLIKKHGPPPFYIDHIRKGGGGDTFFGDNSCKDSSSTNGDRSFVSLCHWVSRQQLADDATLTIWHRLLNVVGATEEDTSNLSPHRILSIKEGGDVESKLRVPSGLLIMKCKCIISIARCFRDGTISDAHLFGGGGVSDDEVRSRLVAIKSDLGRYVQFINFGRAN
ncbi:hypothetical protein ACHAW5_001194 [Stephanodiscus triporus]|uniref:Uncharacterized protein n=1 Tax=Stephanodiscus triporus TaxID=2934178 RepID=A0ABD3NGE8_9STRA